MKWRPASICVHAAAAAMRANPTEVLRLRTQPLWLMTLFNAEKPFKPVQGVLISRMKGLLLCK